MHSFRIVASFVVLSLMFAVNVRAAPTAIERVAEKQKIIAELEPLLEEYKGLEKDEKTLEQRWDDLKWSATQIKKKIDVHEAEFAKHEAESVQYNQAVAAHNSRCTGTFDDHAFVVACNAEMANLNADKARLEQRRGSLNDERSLLNKSIATQTEETEKVFAKHKANAGRMDEIRERANPLIARLKAIDEEVKKCRDAIKSGSNETMHAVCGEMFDGNK